MSSDQTNINIISFEGIEDYGNEILTTDEILVLGESVMESINRIAEIVSNSMKNMQPAISLLTKAFKHFIERVSEIVREYTDSYEVMNYSLLDSISEEPIHEQALYINNLSTGPPKGRFKENLINTPTNLSVIIFLAFCLMFLLINRDMADILVDQLNLDNPIMEFLLTYLGIYLIKYFGII